LYLAGQPFRGRLHAAFTCQGDMRPIVIGDAVVDACPCQLVATKRSRPELLWREDHEPVLDAVVAAVGRILLQLY